MKNNNFPPAPRGGLYIPGGPTGVLLLHSLGGSPLELKLVAHSLARQGYTVYCPVIPGLTIGTDVSCMSTWRDWYDCAEQAMDHLRQTCSSILVGGASAGSVLALRLAAFNKADVAGMVLFAPTLAVNGWAIPMSLKFFHLVSDKWTARLFTFHTPKPYGIKDERVRNFALEALKSEGTSGQSMTTRNGGTVFEFFKLVRNVRGLLTNISLDTLIFHPRHDDQSDLKNTMELQRQLRGAVEVCVLEDSYHLVTLDRQRNFVADRTVKFAAQAFAKAAPEDAAATAQQLTQRNQKSPHAAGNTTSAAE